MGNGKLRWGLLSTANINRRLIPAIRGAERSELVAVASRDGKKAASYAAEWEIPRAFGSYPAMLDSGEIDAVYISTPNSLHVEWAVKAAEAGLQVLCEKPLALRPEGVAAIQAAAEANGVVAAEAFMYLYHPLTLQCRSLIQEGVIGELRLVKGVFSFPLTRPGNVRLAPELGGGCLWDVGCYPVSFIRNMGGEPEAVFGWGMLGESGVDVDFAGLMRLAGGALASFDSSFQRPFRVEAEVIGAEGALRIERPYVMDDRTRLVLRRPDDAEELLAVSEVDPYLCEVEAMEAAVLDGAPLPLSLESSRANVATLVALYRSAAEGRPVVSPL